MSAVSEQINFLRGYITSDEDLYDILHEAADTIEDLSKELAENSGWIPCSSGRLPEDGIDVLVWYEYFRYGEYNRLFRTKGISYTHNGQWSGFVNGQSGWHQLSIIAWQPLPADYQE